MHTHTHTHMYMYMCVVDRSIIPSIEYTNTIKYVTHSFTQFVHVCVHVHSHTMGYNILHLHVRI